MKFKCSSIFLCIGLFAVALLIANCGRSVESTGNSEGGKNVLNSDKRPDWVNEEILQQLNEIRKELGIVKKDVAALNDKVSTIKRVAPTKANRAPTTAPQQVKFDPKRVIGDKDAEFAVIEFTDYQCPFCARHSKQVFQEIKKKLIETGKIKYAVLDFPLNFHAQAKGAAVAANCAGAQGQYWSLHDSILTNQRDLNRESYTNAAKNIGLDVERFMQCLDDPAQIKAVEMDVAYGSSVGVTGTPKFFIGKIKGNVITNVNIVSGARPYSAFAGIIARLEREN